MPNKDIICIIGHSGGKPVWRKVGVFIERTKSGKSMILLDRTFCAAGVVAEEGFASASLYLKEQEEYDPKRKPAQRPSSSFDDFDDDIPF